MARAKHGIVEIVANDEKYTLKPTLEAYDRIEKNFGSLVELFQKIMQRGPVLTINEVTYIVAAGCDINSNKEMKKLKENIYAEGVLAVSPQVAEFISKMLDPSGKAEQKEDADEGE